MAPRSRTRSAPIRRGNIKTVAGLPITSFRLASTQRRYDRGAQKWIDAETNWYTVTTFRQLAINIVGSIEKGQRVVVTGRLRVRDWQTGDRAGTNVEIDADAVGHDLAWGTAVYTRSVASTIAHDADLPSDRAAVLDGGVDGKGSDDSDDSDDSDGDDSDDAAGTARPLEAALPF